jgi:hypothetical protein
LKGYILKWRNSKVIFVCAFFHDLLQPVALLSKALQKDDLCVVHAIEVLMKTKKSLDKLRSTPFEELPSVKKVLGRVKDEAGCVTYQGQDLKMHTQGLTFLKAHQIEWFEAVDSCIENRVKTGEAGILAHAITILATHGWNRSPTPAFAYPALAAVCQCFFTPLESSSVDISQVQGEWDDMIEYSRQYINLVRDDYKVVWWKLFNCADASKWSNILAVVELLFCIPVANGHVERVFSHLKLIKTNRRSSMKEDTLDHLLWANLEGPPLANWDPACTMLLWWREKVRRVNRSTSASTAGPVHSEVEQTNLTGKNGKK